MSFNDDEISVQSSRPAELYEFQFAAPLGTTPQFVRYTSYTRDVNYQGKVFSAATIRRGAFTVVSGTQNIPALTVELPADDQVVKAYAGVGMPPQTLYLTVWRYQATSQQTEQAWAGYVDSCSFRGGRTAVFSVSAITDRTLSTSLPKVIVARLCNHVLYDAYCTVIRNQISPQIVGLSGNAMTVSTIGAFSQTDFPFGEVVHLASKERRTIVAQGGTGGLVMTVDVVWPTFVHVGDSVSIFPGCDHTVETCRDKFANVPNFGGHPHIQSANFFWNDIRKTAGG